MNDRIPLFFSLATLLIAPLTAHEHRAVGVAGTGPGGTAAGGEPLRIIGPDGTGTIHYLRPRGRSPGPRPEGFHPELRGGGYYYLDERPRTIYDEQGNPALDSFGELVIAAEGFSFIALSSEPLFPEAGHAHPGTYIFCEIVSVTGPPGASFGFWESGVSLYSDTPTLILATNQASGNPRFSISEGGDEINADPYGHIHERAWSADKPGDYQLTVRFVDASTNRPGGGPWHPPSRNYTFHFRAGPEFTPVGQRVEGSGFVLTWPSQMGIWETAFFPESGIVFKILRSTTLAPGEWTSIGEVTGTTAAAVSFTDPSPPATNAFYKLAYDWSTP